MFTPIGRFKTPLLGLASAAALIMGIGACGGEKKTDAKGAGDGDTKVAAGNADDIAAGKTEFEKQCTACHSIGEGKRVGPDLKGIGQTRDREWLEKWLKDPVGMSQNDEIGKKIFAEWNNVPMPKPNLDDKQAGQVLDYIDSRSAELGDKVVEAEKFSELGKEDFDKAAALYFDRCSGCHGTLRAGATGPNIQPKRTKEIGTAGIKAILANGTPAGMPAWGRLGILSEEEITLISNYVQMEPPAPPKHDLEDIKATWELTVPVKDRPSEPVTKRNWENYMGVVLRDAGQVAILDGDTKEKVAIIDTGFAVHILRSSHSGRYFYSIGRDGKVTMIDLWPETPQLVAQVRGCLDARSVDASKYKGYEDKFLIEGCYWPTQYVVYDGQTLEPLKVQDVLTNTFDTDEKLDEVRVASIIASHFDPIWVVSLKESGHVALVDYSKPDFPMTAKIGAERFLHDGGWDHTKRYFMVAANMRDTMSIVDVKEQKLVANIKTGTKPHPGRGANWEDPEFGWVNATTHIGEGKMSIYGADPENHPEHAWKVVREVEIDTTGALFVKTHNNSPWVWFDSPLSSEDEKTRRVCVYSKEKGAVEKCWGVFDKGRAVHFEYNKDGTEVWVSGWDNDGALVVYDDKTLEEKTRIDEDWVRTPTGKFNVYNTAQDVY
jgi:nitrite reductase (NO-forming)/hydroxylamine reductase